MDELDHSSSNTHLVQLFLDAESPGSVVSLGSKNTPMIWHRLANPCWVWFVSRSKGSKVDRFFLNPN